MPLFLLAIIISGTTLWLGLYLVNRDLHNPGLRYAGLGLLACAFAWAGLALSGVASTTAIAVTIVAEDIEQTLTTQ
jgi:hypothetical protein